MAEIKIEGIGALKADFEKLDMRKRKPALVKAGLYAIEPVRVLASLLAPRDTGFLAEHIETAEVKRTADIYGVEIEVGPTSKAFYGLFQEFGTAFQTPQPFLDPAVEAAADKVQERAIEGLQRTINEALG